MWLHLRLGFPFFSTLPHMYFLKKSKKEKSTIAKKRGKVTVPLWSHPSLLGESLLPLSKKVWYIFFLFLNLSWHLLWPGKDDDRKNMLSHTCFLSFSACHLTICSHANLLHTSTIQTNSYKHPSVAEGRWEDTYGHMWFKQGACPYSEYGYRHR